MNESHFQSLDDEQGLANNEREKNPNNTFQ
jgi:hypothetical protein